MSRTRGLIALAALVLMSSSSGCADTQGGHGDGSTVGLGEVEVITDASTLAFNPTGEFVFPSVSRPRSIWPIPSASGTSTTHRTKRPAESR